MTTIAALADALYREGVLRARAMSPEDRLLEGPRLFERACRIMTDGIRHQHPDLDAGGIAAVLRERLDRMSALETTVPAVATSSPPASTTHQRTPAP
jgi:hypothetical protein